MTRFTVVAMLGLTLAPPAFADQNTSQERRRAECADQVAHNQHFAKRQEFLDFCLAHTDVEVKRYWVCSSRADNANLGTDSRRGFLDWCVEEENYDDAQASRFSYCNARATNKNLKSDDREEFVNGCVERGEVSDDLRGSYQRVSPARTSSNWSGAIAETSSTGVWTVVTATTRATRTAIATVTAARAAAS